LKRDRIDQKTVGSKAEEEEEIRIWVRIWVRKGRKLCLCADQVKFQANSSRAHGFKPRRNKPTLKQLPDERLVG
jgi:hypothetical protein